MSGGTLTLLPFSLAMLVEFLLGSVDWDLAFLPIPVATHAFNTFAFAKRRDAKDHGSVLEPMVAPAHAFIL